ncbi:MAG: N-acetyltransferase [Porphyrobacter sp.]|nr:N-acetyltransferase [Porphyrobacter sp.]
MSDLIIRPERPGDEAAIFAVTEAAFTGHPHSEGTEPAIVDALRADGDLVLSLVAERAGEIVGHVAYSPAALSGGDEGWMALGPISVHPNQQGQGIGRALVEAGSKHWQEAGAKGVVLLGDPALYGRFGFVRETPLHITGPLAEYFQTLPFTAEIPASSVTFAQAFRLARPTNR